MCWQSMHCLHFYGLQTLVIFHWVVLFENNCFPDLIWFILNVCKCAWLQTSVFQFFKKKQSCTFFLEIYITFKGTIKICFSFFYSWNVSPSFVFLAKKINARLENEMQLNHHLWASRPVFWTMLSTRMFTGGEKMSSLQPATELRAFHSAGL